MVGLCYRRKLCGTREASNGGRVRVRIIHGLNISHKELIYLLQKSRSYQSKVLHACSQGDRLVGKDHRSSPTATHKEDNQKINHAPTSSHNGSPYVHATGITNFNTSIYQIHNYSTSTTLTIHACYRTCKLQHKHFSNSQLLNQHDFDIITSMSQNNYHASIFSQYSTHSKESFTNLEYQAYYY